MSKSQPSGPHDRKIRILLAEGRHSRSGVRLLFSSQPDFLLDAEPAEVDDVLAAIIQRSPHTTVPDILVLDVEGLGGATWSIIEEMRVAARKDIGDGRPRAILLTSADDRKVYAEALRSGVVGIVQKDTPPDLLVKSVRKVHAGEMWLDRAKIADVIRTFAALPHETESEPEEQKRDSSALSKRERQVVALVVQGLKNREIAEEMSISDQTVKNHLHKVFEKLGVSDRLELALYAIRENVHTE